MPGSTNACNTAWGEVICEQLDASHRPCNFVAQLKKVDIAACESRG
jgi:molybdenum cofactor biosynthesis protein B